MKHLNRNISAFIRTRAAALLSVALVIPLLTLGWGAAQAVAAAAPQTATPAVTCSTYYGISNIEFGDNARVSLSSPYNVYFSAATPTNFCRVGDTWEQDGTSKCMDLNGSNEHVDMASCSAVAAGWTVVSVPNGDELKNAYNGKCLYFVGDTIDATWLNCNANDNEGVFDIIKN